MNFLDYKSLLEEDGYTVSSEAITTRLGDVLAAFDPYGDYWCADGRVQEILATNLKPKETNKVRARTDKGHFVKDDPNTPENEAWVTK